MTRAWPYLFSLVIWAVRRRQPGPSNCKRGNFDNKLHVHTFVIADVVEPMLGWDFLSQHLAVIVAKDPHTYFQCVCEAASTVPAQASFVPYRRPTKQRSAPVRQSKFTPYRRPMNSSGVRARLPGSKTNNVYPKLRKPQLFRIPTPKSCRQQIFPVNRIESMVKELQQEFSDICRDGDAYPNLEPLHGTKHFISHSRTSRSSQAAPPGSRPLGHRKAVFPRNGRSRSL